MRRAAWKPGTRVPPGQRRRFWLGFLVPLLLILSCGVLARMLPEDQLLPTTIRSVLLTLPRWLPGLWVIWGLWAWRRGNRVGLGVAGASVLMMGIPPIWPQGDDGVLLVVANVNAYSGQVSSLEKALGELDADMVVLIEKRAARIPGMQRVAHNYDDDLPKPSHGTAVYCDRGLLCNAWISPEFGADECGMPIAVTRVEGAMCVVGIHAPPPMPLCAKGLQPYVTEVASHISSGRMREDWGPCKNEDPVLVIGDLNYVPGSHAWRTLLDVGLDDRVAWQGVWASSWPAGGGWPPTPFFRLDHVLAGDLWTSTVRYFRLPDADHRAIRLRIKP